MSNEANEGAEQSLPSLDQLISLKEAAKQSGMSNSHLRLLARTKEMWAIKMGRTWFTTEQAVQAYLARDIRPGPKPQA